MSIDFDIGDLWCYNGMGLPARTRCTTNENISEAFCSLLLDIQKDRPYVIASGIYVLDAFGLVRSARRGATTRAQASKVPQDGIDRVNH
jgi:hypothetical protein